VGADGSYMLDRDCKPGVDYWQEDLAVGEENLSHRMIGPSYSASSIVYYQVAAPVEAVLLGQDVEGVCSRYFEEAEGESTSYVAARGETWAAEVGHRSQFPLEEVFVLVGTWPELLCEWQGDKRYLAECMKEQVLDLKLQTLLLVLKESSRQ
jgi:hypothetical protein